MFKKMSLYFYVTLRGLENSSRKIVRLIVDRVLGMLLKIIVRGVMLRMTGLSPLKDKCLQEGLGFKHL